MTSIAPRTAQYGSWSSPVTAASLTAHAVMLGEPRIDGDDVYWLEGRPSDGGRVVVVRRGADGQTTDVTGSPFNVRSRVHEYGGGAYAVRDGVLVFCNFDDTRVYVVAAGSTAEPRPLTPSGPLRYGDLRFWPGDASITAVCEDHGGDGEPANRLVRLDLDTDNAEGGRVLVEGPDFVSSAVVHPDGRRIAWTQWNHPNMPFDATELCLADVSAGGQLDNVRVIAGRPGESAIQPRWSGDRLVYISDRTGWWNLYEHDDLADEGPTALRPADAEFGDPQWVFGMSAYAVASADRIVCTWVEGGYHRLGILDRRTGTLERVQTDAVLVGSVQVDRGRVVVQAGFPDRPDAIVELDLDAPDHQRVLRSSTSETLDPAYVSVAEPVTWSASDGSPVHGYYYAPRNPEFVGPDDDRPPLVVMSHGGPTGMTTAAFARSRQFWTTRGFAVLDVNYGGSSGYGRAYRERLRGQWGVVDVDDCATGALAMAERGLVDRQRLAIRGGSAGGYTTLAALTFTDVFAVGCSLFGVGDLETLVRDTHKFESRYLDGLIGPYPEAKDRYVERSPIHHVDEIDCPIILLQGADDMVVPRNQAETMADAVRAKGLPVALIVFDGEGHGFRRAENQIRSIEAETYFYSQIFGFDLADDVEPVEIDNPSR